MRVSLGSAGLRPLLAFVASLGLVTAGCGLDKVEDPPLVGPSETGLSVQLTALPDTLNADGVSVSVIQFVLREQNGQPVSGRAILFEHDGDGVLAPSASSTYVGPIQTGIVHGDRPGRRRERGLRGGHRHRAGQGRGRSAVRHRRQPHGFERTVEIFQR